MLVEFDLIQKAQQGDATAFNQVVTAYRRRILGTISRLIGRPEDVAGAAVFLASGDGEYVTQQCLNVDGGNWPS